MDLRRIVPLAAALWMAVGSGQLNAATEENIYIGTYTGAKSQGIYYSRFDEANGSLAKPELAAVAKNPSFLAVDSKHEFLYVVNEVGDFGGKHAGAASAFAIDRNTGKLGLLNQRQTGDGPCHLSIDKSGTKILVANYGGGNVQVLGIKPDGGLEESKERMLAEGDAGSHQAFVQHHGSSVNPQRQTGPHAHFILTDPNNRFAMVCDLGLDRVFAYPFDSKLGTLDEKNAVSFAATPGAGPRHLAFHPSGKYVYVINEMASTVTACKFDKRSGRLEMIGSYSTLPAEFKGQSTCAEVQIDPGGRFVYGSNRGDDSIAVFAVDAKSGALKFVERQSTHGKTPRHFTLSPTGRWLLCGNQESDGISVFKVARENGRLTFSGNTEVGAPVCILFAGRR